MPALETLDEYLAAHKKTHLIFDFDATLFLLLLPWETWGMSMRETLSKIDASIWDAWHNREINISELQNQYVDTYGDEALQIILEHNERFERELLQGWEPHADLLQTVKNVDTGIKKYVWSSNTREVINLVLKEERLTHLFEGIVSRDDVTLLKPDPEGFYKLWNPEVNKNQYLMVGDSKADRQAAKSAGIDFFYVDFFKQRL